MRWNWYFLPAILALLVTVHISHADPGSSESIRQLRRSLSTPAHDLASRADDLRVQTASIKQITELAEALALPEWRDLDVDEAIAAVDRQYRGQLTERFATSVHTVLQEGDSFSQVVVIDLVARLGTGVRRAGSDENLARTFTERLAERTRSDDPRVREAAMRALGQINPNPVIAVPALARLMQAQDEPTRRLAAQTLEKMAVAVVELTSRSRNLSGPRLNFLDAARLGCAIVPVVGNGLLDRDAAVRHASMGAITVSSAALSKLILISPAPAQASDSSTAWDELVPMLLSLQECCPTVAAMLLDPNENARQQALNALQEIALLRQRLRRRFSSVPEDPLLAGLVSALDPLAASLSQRDVAVRRNTLTILETLGPAAAPVVPALVLATHDSDRFVRWAAARTLGKIAPKAPEQAVPALVRLLEEADPDVRLAALMALEHFGSAAESGSAQLVRILRRRDSLEMRTAAIRVLSALGEPGVKLLVPELQNMLGDSDESIRLLATQKLGQLRSAALPAVESLRQIRFDQDPRVQQAAGTAILQILAQDETPKKK